MELITKLFETLLLAWALVVSLMLVFLDYAETSEDRRAERLEDKSTQYRCISAAASWAIWFVWYY